MRYVEHPVPPDLAPFVMVLWGLETDGGGPPERILPDGIAEAVFHYRRPFEDAFAGAELRSQARSFVVLQASKYLDIRPVGASGFVSVRFFAGAFSSFVSVPLATLADQSVPSGELWGDEIVEVEDRLAAAKNDGERFGVVIAFLRRCLRRHEKRSVAALVEAVTRPGGRIRVADLAASAGVSARQLQRVFRDRIGLTPKSFARICRFLSACHMLRDGERPLAGVAAACGYFDQAHLVHEVRAFAGESPSALRDREDVSFL